MTLRLWGLPLAAMVVGVCFAPSLPALWHQWWDSGTFNHCLIVIPAAAWLVWEAEHARLRQGMDAPPETEGHSGVGFHGRVLRWLPHVALFGFAVLWFIARLLSVSVVEQGALIAAIPTLAWAINGTAWARRNRFALLFCLLATPVGEFLVPPLMELTATITVALVRLCGIPVLRDGMQLTMASGNFVVAEACSGIRYLIATVTLSLLFAHLTYRSLNRKLWFLLAAILAPLLANGLRAWLMVMIAHFTDLQYATGFDHLVYGWVFFGVVIVVLFFVGSLFQESGASSLPQSNHSSSLTQGPVQSFAPSFVGASLLAIVLLAWAPFAYLAAAQAMASVPGQLSAYAFPEKLGAYRYAGPASFPTPLEYAGADRIDIAAYQYGGNTLYVAAVRYERDRPGHKFVSQSNRPYSFDWNRVGSGTVFAESLQLRYDDLRPKIRQEEAFAPVVDATATMEPGAASALGPWRVYSWYSVAGRTTISAMKAKLLAVLDWRTPRAATPPPTVFLVAMQPSAAIEPVALHRL